MSLTLNIRNLDKVLAEVKAYPQDVEKIINNEFKAFGQGTVNDAKRLAPVNEGRLRQSISSLQNNLEVKVSVNVDYAAYLEFGTKSFAAQYVSSLPSDWQTFASEFKGSAGGSFQDLVMKITKWVRLKGLPEKAAYPIALKIIRNGIKAQPYLFPAFEKNKLELIKNLKAQLHAKS